MCFFYFCGLKHETEDSKKKSENVRHLDVERLFGSRKILLYAFCNSVQLSLYHSNVACLYLPGA